MAQLLYYKDELDVEFKSKAITESNGLNLRSIILSGILGYLFYLFLSIFYYTLAAVSMVFEHVPEVFGELSFLTQITTYLSNL